LLFSPSQPRSLHPLSLLLTSPVFLFFLLGFQALVHFPFFFFGVFFFQLSPTPSNPPPPVHPSPFNRPCCPSVVLLSLRGLPSLFQSCTLPRRTDPSDSLSRPSFSANSHPISLSSPTEFLSSNTPLRHSPVGWKVPLQFPDFPLLFSFFFRSVGAFHALGFFRLSFSPPML